MLATRSKSIIDICAVNNLTIGPIGIKYPESPVNKQPLKNRSQIDDVGVAYSRDFTVFRDIDHTSHVNLLITLKKTINLKGGRLKRSTEKPP